MQFPVGYRFHPTDTELVGFYLYNKIFQPTLLSGNNNVIDFDLYGSHEPSEIWTLFGGESLLEDDPSLFFFTNLKKKSSKSRRICRTVASGTWAGEDGGETIQTGYVVGLKKRFRYENPSSPQDRAWIMHEYSFDSNETVVCQLKRNRSVGGQRRVRGNRKRKSKSTEEDVGDSELSVQTFQPKRPRTEHCPALMLESQSVHSLTTVQPEEEALDFCFVDEEEKELLMQLLEDLPTLLPDASHSGPDYGLQRPQLSNSFDDVVTVETEESTTESSSYSLTIPAAVDSVTDADDSWWADILF